MARHDGVIFLRSTKNPIKDREMNGEDPSTTATTSTNCNHYHRTKNHHNQHPHQHQHRSLVLLLVLSISIDEHRSVLHTGRHLFRMNVGCSAFTTMILLSGIWNARNRLARRRRRQFTTDECVNESLLEIWKAARSDYLFTIGECTTDLVH